MTRSIAIAAALIAAVSAAVPAQAEPAEAARLRNLSPRDLAPVAVALSGPDLSRFAITRMEYLGSAGVNMTVSMPLLTVRF